MSTDIVIKHFEGKPVAFHVSKERLTLTMREVAELLGYKDEGQAINRLYVTHKDEFDHDCTHINILADSASVNCPPLRQRVFTLEGLILLSMFSTQPIAAKFRHWLRKVAREVAVTGSYNSSVLTQILNQMNETVLLQGKMIQNLAAEVHAVKDTQTRTLIVAKPDSSHWWTAGARIRHLITPSVPPKGFNSAAAFDWYAAQRHFKEYGSYPEQRSRRHINKLPEYVYEPCPEMDRFLRDCYRDYLKNEWGSRQGKLKLVPANSKREAKK